jgi:hypothetical protein
VTCANGERQRQARYRGRGPAILAPVPEQPAAKPAGPGEVELATLVELGNAPRAADRPADCANAVSQARILDDESLVRLWPKAAARLQSILNTLWDVKKQQKRRRLASVQSMTNVRRRVK